MGRTPSHFGVFNSKRQTVPLLSPDGKFTLSAGEHKLILQALDAAGQTGADSAVIP